MNKIKKIFVLTFLTFFFSIINIKAASFSTKVSNGTVRQGENINVTITLSNMDESLGGYQGVLSYDKTKLQYVSVKFNNLSNWYQELNTSSGNFIAYNNGAESNVVKNSRTVITLTFKAIAQGTATVEVNNMKGSDCCGGNLTSNGSTGTITINPPPSTNNNLSSLTVTDYPFNFNTNTTSYSIDVASSVTSLKVNATVADSKANITISGQNNLKYGTNSISIVVTAESGTKKTYTIKVNRKDDRSINNYLKSLSISSQTISPGFNKNTTNYTLNVPYAISSLKIDTVPEDSKAKVEISGQHNLLEGKQNKITITVTAENGSKRTYTVTVFRGNNPDRPLANNNNLSSIKVSVGELSPAFSKDVLNYEVWLPFETSTIKITVTQEDSKAIIEKDEVTELISGFNNKFTYTVIAENGSKKEYVINVKRAKDPNISANNNNNYLSSVIIKNGKLSSKFDKKKQVYTYSGNNIEIAGATEDELATIRQFKNNDHFYLLIIAENGEERLYEFSKAKSNLLILILIIGLVISTILNIWQFIKNK